MITFLIAGCSKGSNLDDLPQAKHVVRGKSEPEVREYVDTWFCRNTFVTRVKSDVESWVFAEKDGNATIVIRRGGHRTRGNSSHHWHQQLCLVYPAEPTLGKIDLGAGKIRLGFSEGPGINGLWSIGNKGVSGYFEIETVDRDRIVANYDIVVYIDKGTGVYREVEFRGSSTFKSIPLLPPETLAAHGKLFPE